MLELEAHRGAQPWLDNYAPVYASWGWLTASLVVIAIVLFTIWLVLGVQWIRRRWSSTTVVVPATAVADAELLDLISQVVVPPMAPGATDEAAHFTSNKLTDVEQAKQALRIYLAVRRGNLLLIYNASPDFKASMTASGAIYDTHALSDVLLWLAEGSLALTKMQKQRDSKQDLATWYEKENGILRNALEKALEKVPPQLAALLKEIVTLSAKVAKEKAEGEEGTAAADLKAAEAKIAALNEMWERFERMIPQLVVNNQPRKGSGNDKNEDNKKTA